MTNIAFIGLGNMGLPMAVNLIEAGHTVTGFDINEHNTGALSAAGGRAAGTVQQAVAGAQVIVTMLPAGRHVREVYLDADGIVANADADCLLIDCSTIDVASAREVIARAKECGFAMIDAPVSGGVMGAKAGTLTFMCGGETDAFEHAKPFLDHMGKTVIHAGGAGNGQAAKICNNMILGISMIGVSEAFVLAEKLGLDHQKLFDVASAASGQCWSLTTYCPVPGPVPASPANRDYTPGFTAAMMLKDLRLAQQAANIAGAAAPLGAQACALYGLFAAAGDGETDFSGIIKLLRGA